MHGTMPTTTPHEVGHKNAVTGRVPQPTAGTPVFYTDGSVSRRKVAKKTGWLTGWGYISTDGRYGCGRYPQFDGIGGTDGSVSLTTELRAIWQAIGDQVAAGAVTVFTDSTAAIGIIEQWKTGATTMPLGYTGSARKTPTLQLFRQAVVAHPGRLTVQHVKGHGGEVLNEAADTLAQLGMRWTRDKLDRDDVARRAEGVAEGFLADYRRHR